MQSVKSTLNKWIFGGLLVLVAVGFVVSDTNGNFFGGSQDVIAKIGRANITTQDFIKTFDEERKNLAAQMGQDISVQTARSQGMDHYVLEQMINKSAFLQYAESLQMRVGDDRIADFIVKLPIFLKSDEKTFDPQAFKQFLTNRHTSEREFKKQIHDMLLLEDLQNILSPKITAPSTLAEVFYKQKHEQREVDVLAFTPAHIQLPDVPKDKELQDFYEKNKEDFRIPEYRTAVIAEFNADSLKSSISVSQDELEKAYQNRISEFSVPEKRQVYQYLFPSQQEAETFIKDYNAKGDFLEFADKKGFPRAKHDLGLIQQKDLTAESMKTVFSLPVHTPSTIVETDFGHAVYYVPSIQNASQKPFADVKSVILADLQAQKAADKMATLLVELEDLQAAGTSIEDIAKKYAVKPVTFTDITEIGVLKDGTQAPVSSMVLTAIFKTGINADDPVLEEDNGNKYYMYRVDSIDESNIPQLQDIEKDVIALWKSRTENLKLSQLVSQIKAKIEKKELSVSDIAEKYNVFVKKQTVFADKMNPDFDPQMAERIFRAKLNKAVTGQDAKKEKWLVAYIAEQKIPDTESKEAKAEIRKLENRFNDLYADELYQQFANAVRESVGTEIHYDVMAQVLQRASH